MNQSWLYRISNIFVIIKLTIALSKNRIRLFFVVLFALLTICYGSSVKQGQGQGQSSGI